MLNAKLVVVGGEAKATEINLKLPTVIGRGREGVSLTIAHRLVSRRHTELFEENGRLFAKDLGSLNGTFVNNTRISEPQPIEPNELLTLGNVTFRAVYDRVGTAGKIDNSQVGGELETVDAPAQTATKVDDDALDTQDAPTPVHVNETVEAPPAVDNGSVSVKNADKMIDEAKVDLDDVHLIDELAQSAAGLTDDSLLRSDVYDTDNGLKTDDVPSADSAPPTNNESSFIIFGEGVQPGSNDSISASELGSLPGPASHVSYLGTMNLDGEGSVEQVESVMLDVGNEASSNDIDDAGLGSFLRKLPK